MSKCCVCGVLLLPGVRRLYCSGACRQVACRRRARVRQFASLSTLTELVSRVSSSSLRASMYDQLQVLARASK